MHRHETDLLIPLFALMIPMVVVPTVLYFRHARQRREWRHRERMRALELGQPISDSQAWPALVAIAMGAGVPVGAFFFSWLAVETARVDEEVVFVSATLVALAGVIAGSKLAMRLCIAAAPAERGTVKPSIPDADLFDVVGRRG